MPKPKVGRTLGKDELNKAVAPLPSASFAFKLASPKTSNPTLFDEIPTGNQKLYTDKKGTGIREVKLSDVPDLAILLSQLGYPDTEVFLSKQLNQMFGRPNEVLLVYEKKFKVEAFIGLHYFRQFGTEGDFARITYFVTRDGSRSKGMGGALEDCVTKLALGKKCDRLEVHCHSRRTDAHRFYLRQQYVEAPKYFMKMVKPVNSFTPTPLKNGVIRTAKLKDAKSIQSLLHQLGYSYTEHFLPKKMEESLNDKDEVIFVYEQNSHIQGFISAHLFPQVGLEGDFTRITYFCVSDNLRGQGIGGQLEDHVYQLARQRNCNRIELHCNDNRLEAHEFYLKHGYEESPKYFIKSLATS